MVMMMVLRSKESRDLVNPTDTQTQDYPEGWIVEVVGRGSSHIIAITKDKVVRGSITVYNATELHEVVMAITGMNKK